MSKNIPFSLGKNFDKIIEQQLKNPKIAILELISNSWDANANNVYIKWPDKKGLLDIKDKFSILDDGYGMSKDEFVEKWKTIGYDKRNKIDDEKNKREILGKNGRGRLGIFCFSDEYIVSTSKNEKVSTFKVTRDAKNFATIEEIETIDKPFKHDNKLKNGTYIECPLNKEYISLNELKETINLRFGADQKFNIYLNNEKIDLFNLKDNEKYEEIFYKENSIKIFTISKNQLSKKLSTYEIVWWVKNRYVEHDKWKDLNINLNSSKSNENKYVFLVCADFLEEFVKSDWTGFENNDLILDIKEFVANKINQMMNDVIELNRKERKKLILKSKKEEISCLNPIKKQELGRYLEEIMKNCKSITDQDFSNIVSTLIKMENSNKKYDFFENILNVSPDDLDKLTEIVEKWSINDAYLVLNELYTRLELIKKLDYLIDNPQTKEVQQLQPLFKEGLWIFNPKYEGTTRFTSNKSMNNVMKEILNITDYVSENSKKRPDFVVTPNSTLSTFTSNAYVEDSDVIKGYDEVLIIELKKGNSEIGYAEKEQAFKYAKEISDKGKVSNETKIIAYVLGTSIKPTELNARKEGNIVVYPKQYDLIISTAKKRTFDLINKIKNVKGITDIGDNEINEVLTEDEQTSLD